MATRLSDSNVDDSVRIAHIVADGRPGGGSTVVLGLIDEMARNGGMSITLISEPRSYLEEQARRLGVEFVGCNLFTGWFDPTPPWRLLQALGPRRFDLAHLHGLRAAHHAVRCPLRARLGRLVYTIHGLHQLHAPQPVRALANVVERQAMQRVDVPVFVSHADLESARQWALLPAQSAATVIWNGIDVDAIDAHARVERRFDVIFVGRHVEQKQPLLAARVLAALAAGGWRCAMAGGGPLEADCRAELARTAGGTAVEVLGELPHAAALDALAGSRVVVMPSAWEGLPVLPLEAMALGVPVVASNVAGIAEVMGADCGVLVEPDDETGFERAVEAVLTDAELENRLRRAGAQRVRAYFQRSGTSARYRGIYDQLLGAIPVQGRPHDAS